MEKIKILLFIGIIFMTVLLTFCITVYLIQTHNLFIPMPYKQNLGMAINATT